ncbi:MAG: hypothetical protein AUH29_05685 [Candidatus Rokubacteria bacterium 13_1_40CM_69_27]|nr:MAG: hypothetical protein AUH29_05685 [Candidatus Rokubacteria bacterium 13_1_40CM_69_27]OLC32485.1 MAG: hypothetical protein AUH81_16230 [Candidatus Rokubacteria bacterium 13_1_40CM_4_69_5]OLE38168.1 MAG: hypothetical protein AUG00_06140 [Candidatus Rokubacteria bacterium 13_1_20CM_2_70_7]
MDITIRKVLGHMWGPQGECVLVVDAELCGTVRQALQIVLSTEAETAAFKAILDAHDHHLSASSNNGSPQRASASAFVKGELLQTP